MDEPYLTAQTVSLPSALALSAVATICLALVVGLGFLGRPTRSYLLWTIALGVGCASAYGTVAASATGSVALLQPLSVGAAMSIPVFVWSGLRALRGTHTYGWVGFAVLALSCAVLTLTSQTPGYNLVFRATYFVAGLFAGACALEVARGPARRLRGALPLTIASIAFFVTATAGLVAGLVLSFLGIDDLTQTRDINTIGSMAYGVCVTVGMLLIGDAGWSGARGGGPSAALSADAFAATAGMRLARAELREEHAWSLVDVRIDDLDDVRDAFGDVATERLTDRFERMAEECFPGEADIGVIGPGHLQVLVARPAIGVREHVRTLLELVSDAGTESAGVRLSASAGIAPLDAAGYDLAQLQRLAGDAAVAAWREGGDRWHRLSADRTVETG